MAYSGPSSSSRTAAVRARVRRDLSVGRILTSCRQRNSGQFLSLRMERMVHLEEVVREAEVRDLEVLGGGETRVK